MARAFIPPLIPIAPEATPEERAAALEAYKADLRRYNPQCFRADGTLKTLWERVSDTLRKVGR